MDTRRVNQEKALRGQYFRLRQGLSLCRDQQVEHLEDDDYLVCEEGESFTVRLEEKGCECSCPDFTKYRRPCKHVVAASAWEESGSTGFRDKQRRWARRSAVVTGPVVGMMEGVFFKTRALKLALKLLVGACLLAVAGVVMSLTADRVAESMGIAPEDAFFYLVMILLLFIVLAVFPGGRSRRRRR